MDNNPAVSWQYVCMICRRVGRGKKKLHVHSKLVQHGNALRPRLHTLAKLLRGGGLMCTYHTMEMDAKNPPLSKHCHRAFHKRSQILKLVSSFI